MTDYTVRFDIVSEPVQVPSGTLVVEAARIAGIDIGQPCGGQGRCGRCVVRIEEGLARRRSTLHLSPEDVEKGFALACQTVVEGDLTVSIPPQDKIERRLTTDRTVAAVEVPVDYEYFKDQTIRRVKLKLDAPSMDDQRDDLSRLRTALRQQVNLNNVIVPLDVLRKLGSTLRDADWMVTVILDVRPTADGNDQQVRLIDVISGHVDEHQPLWGAAIDIGTTTVTLWLVDLVTGQVKAQVSEYNGQISRGEDVISRIVYASKGDGGKELQDLVLDSIRKLLDIACKRAGGLDLVPEDVIKVTVSGNSTMMHLFLDIPPASIRLTPFITAVNNPPLYLAKEIGLNINPCGIVDCLPGVASYVGSDITAGVLSSGMTNTELITLFMDVGTNGEIVLGNSDWLVTCACSAGPAFEGAGVVCGMRATKGAIEEVWINGETYEPSYRVIGGTKPKGICGSGLISLLAELFITGVVDKAGHLKKDLNTRRVREGEHGLEYIVAWKDESGVQNDIVITAVDIDNLIRAKGAIYAGYQVLADNVGVPLEMIEQMLIGGSFGKYINVEKAVQIGLLPDLPWERFNFLGNTSIKGAYLALLDQEARKKIESIASRMTYIELSADNSFFEAFMSALFLPHTDMTSFPSVEKAISGVSS
jgi:uncharacterized 2Fe-2S/4Fe-4S cluster protein (DUF4445 family)